MSSAFKQLVTTMFTNGGDFSKVPAGQRNQAISCYVKESLPYFLVSDNFNYMGVYFTKKAIDDFRSKNSNTHISDLKSRVISITEWSLELARVDSQNVFTSYGGLELKLIAKAFSVNKSNSKIVLSRHPTNIYRDSEIKTTIQAFQHAATVAGASSAKAGMPDLSSFKASGAVSQGVVSAAAQYKFKAGNTATVAYESIIKQEKGSNALSNVSKSNGSGKVKAVGGASARKSKSGGKKSSGKRAAPVGALMRSSSANNKKSVTMGARGQMATPGTAGPDGSANVSSMRDFNKMVSMINKKKAGKSSKK
jgi:hypothetical protein